MRATKVGADTALAQIARLVDERADRQGAGAAARRPRLGRLRAGRHRARRRHARLLARHRRERDVRVHRRRRRADHRLPVRARARHADRADGRHRPRRPARAADQGPGGARVHAPGRHGRARQDRHGHDRPDELVDVAVAEGVDRDEALRLVGALEDASEHPIAQAIAGRRRAAARCPPSRASPTARASASRASSTATRVIVGRPALLRRLGACTLPPELDAARARGRGARAGPRSPPAGTARAARRLRRSPTPSSRLSAEAVAALRGARPAPGPADRRQRARPPSAVAAEVGIDEVIAEVLPADKADVVRRLQARGPRRGDGRRRRQRRAGARPGRPRPGDRHRHRRGDRGLRPHARLRRPARRRATRSACRARRCARSSRTWRGRSATTSPRSRWPRSGCSTR